MAVVLNFILTRMSEFLSHFKIQVLRTANHANVAPTSVSMLSFHFFSWCERKLIAEHDSLTSIKAPKMF